MVERLESERSAGHSILLLSRETMSATNGVTNEAPHVATTSKPAAPSLWITGIASKFPPYSLDPERLENIAARFHDMRSPG